MELLGKNAVITGGCGGIGKHLAFELFQKGVKSIGLFDIGDSNKTEEFLKEHFPDRLIKYYQTDVANKSNLMESFEMFKKNFGNIDIVIVGAGILNEFSIEKMIEINLIGAINTIYLAMDHMSISNTGNGGIIVSISSISGVEFPIIAPCYSATKHGLLAFTKSMANKINNQKHGIRFITICPGRTDTEILSKEKYKEIFLADFLTAAEAERENFPMQSPEILAKLSMDPIISGKDGSIWIIDDGQTLEHVP